MKDIFPLFFKHSRYCGFILFILVIGAFYVAEWVVSCYMVHTSGLLCVWQVSPLHIPQEESSQFIWPSWTTLPTLKRNLHIVSWFWIFQTWKASLLIKSCKMFQALGVLCHQTWVHTSWPITWWEGLLVSYITLSSPCHLSAALFSCWTTHRAQPYDNLSKVPRNLSTFCASRRNNHP